MSRIGGIAGRDNGAQSALPHCQMTGWRRGKYSPEIIAFDPAGRFTREKSSTGSAIGATDVLLNKPQAASYVQ
jgi:hypothetical protein